MEHKTVEAANGPEQRHLVRVALAIDTDARLGLASPTGRVSTPAELVIHIRCPARQDQDHADLEVLVLWLLEAAGVTQALRH